MAPLPDIHPADPDSPAAAACLAAYFTELAARFPEGFDPGPGPHGAAFRPPAGAFLLAEGRLGCVGLSEGPDGSTLEVKRLWVAPVARGTGLARRLMGAAEDAARATGAARLVLDTHPSLAEAIAFYTREGWQPIPRYNDNPYAGHWFAKALGAAPPAG
ncbi:MAG TPA: GNAT family N-acetyltransferase [Paracoccaceae bacterium]|nr:GNAT family N-acetyltransferase [Paracoccaceae bacterium]HMO70659.1 GNAT family N-acetyltransferase [Paracoccaceae bacterium]